MVSRRMGRSISPIRNKLIPLLFLPKDHTTYYSYQGSLTTPGCDESVIWFVMTEKLFVSEAQVIQYFTNKLQIKSLSNAYYNKNNYLMKCYIKLYRVL